MRIERFVFISSLVMALSLLAVTVPCFAADPCIAFVPSVQHGVPGSVVAFDLVIDQIPYGLSGYEVNVMLNVSGVAEIVGVTFPSWAGLSYSSTLPADSVQLAAVDIEEVVSAGATNVMFATLLVRCDASGAANLGVSVIRLDQENGSPYSFTVSPGMVVVESSMFVVPLKQGWNLVSWPVNGTLMASSLVGNVSLGVDYVTMYNPVTKVFKSYYPGASPSKDFALTPDMGYYVRAAGVAGFGVSGAALPGHSISVYQGWNLIGWSSYTDVYASDLLAGASYLDYVTMYNASTKVFKSYYPGASPSKNFLVTAGNGYYVRSTSASVQQLYIG